MNDQIKIKSMSLILKEKLFEKARFYNGKPSVTTVLKLLLDEGMEKIKLIKGEDAWDKMMNLKAAQGTILHNAIENSYKSGKFHPINTPHAQALLNFWTREGHKRSPEQLEFILEDDMVGGTADGLFSYGSRFLVDWKSCGKQVYESLVFKYKLQISKYIDIYNKFNEEKILQGKIILFSESGWYRPLIVNNIDYFKDMFDELCQEFYSLKKIWNETQSGTSGVQQSSICGQGSMSNSNSEVSPPANISMNGWDY